jgi:hypothetical protein
MPVSSISRAQIQVIIEISENRCVLVFFSSRSEPVGSVAPRLTAGISKIQTLEGIIDGSSTLLCPAQSFPVPSYRYLNIRSFS